MAAFGIKPKHQPPVVVEAPDCPPGAAYLWSWFLQLHAGRRSGGFGPANLAYVDIEAFFRLHRIKPEPWEIEAIMAVDGEWLNVQAEKPG